MLFKKILVVLDPHKEKQFALERAIQLVKEQKDELKTPVKITLFMAVYDVAYEMSELLSADQGNAMKQHIISHSRQDLTSLLRQYDTPNVEFDTIVVWNNNESDAITEVVQIENFDLVVKNTQAKDEGLAALIFTPQDWQLLRKCPAPIMMVRNDEWQHKRRILIAVNTGENDDAHESFNHELVKLGMEMAANLNRGNVHLVTAYPPSAVNLKIDMPEFNTPASEHQECLLHTQNMQKLAEYFGIAQDHTHIVEGFPEEVIPAVAKVIDAELVVLGTVGRRGLAAAFLGNTAEHVVSRLHCNLLAIKPSQAL